MTPFHAHYQSVYANFDFSSFSRISCAVKAMLLNPKSIAKDREFAHKTRNKLAISILQKSRIFSVFATKDKVGCK